MDGRFPELKGNAVLACCWGYGQGRDEPPGWRAASSYEQPMRALSNGCGAGGRAWLAGPAAGVLQGWGSACGRAVGPGVLCLVLRLYLASKRAWWSRQPSSELAEGAGLLTLTNGFHPRQWRALPLAVGARPRRSCGLCVHLLAGATPPGGDVGVPGDAAGDDGVDLADQRGGDRGAGLLVGELVVGTAGQCRRAGRRRRRCGAARPRPRARLPAAAWAGRGGRWRPRRRGCRWSSRMVPGRRA